MEENKKMNVGHKQELSIAVLNRMFQACLRVGNLNCYKKPELFLWLMFVGTVADVGLSYQCDKVEVKAEGAPKCPRCNDRVYFNEEKKALGKTWHTRCFTCSKIIVTVLIINFIITILTTSVNDIINFVLIMSFIVILAEHCQCVQSVLRA